MDELLTTVEAAAVAGVTESTLRYWRHVGEGPKSFTLGRRKVMYKKSDVVAWLDEQYAKADAGAMK